MDGYKYLIITSSGGGAHLMVAKARKQFLLDKGVPKEEIYVVDIMGVDKEATKPGESWVPNIGVPGTQYQFFLGKSIVQLWNSTQKLGGLEAVRRQEFLASFQSKEAYLQDPTMYYRLKAFIEVNEDLIEVYDTQALSTSALCHAVYEANQKRLLMNYPKL